MTKRLGLLLTLFILIASGPQRANAQITEQRLTELRKIVEEEIKSEFEEALSKFNKLAIAKDPHVLQTDPNGLKRAEDGVRKIFYDRAYILYSCMKLAATAAVSKGSTGVWDNWKACYAERTNQMTKALKILTQYTSLLKGKGSKEAQCELQARLFDAENEFPPFDFLKSSDGEDGLYDYAAMNACLLSITR